MKRSLNDVTGSWYSLKCFETLSISMTEPIGSDRFREVVLEAPEEPQGEEEHREADPQGDAEVARVPEPPLRREQWRAGARDDLGVDRPLVRDHDRDHGVQEQDRRRTREPVCDLAVGVHDGCHPEPREQE